MATINQHATQILASIAAGIVVFLLFFGSYLAILENKIRKQQQRLQDEVAREIKKSYQSKKKKKD